MIERPATDKKILIYKNPVSPPLVKLTCVSLTRGLAEQLII